MLLCDSRVEGGVVPIYNNMLHDEEHFFIHTTRGGGAQDKSSSLPDRSTANDSALWT